MCVFVFCTNLVLLFEFSRFSCFYQREEAPGSGVSRTLERSGSGDQINSRQTITDRVSYGFCLPVWPAPFSFREGFIFSASSGTQVTERTVSLQPTTTRQPAVGTKHKAVTCGSEAVEDEWGKRGEGDFDINPISDTARNISQTQTPHERQRQC